MHYSPYSIAILGFGVEGQDAARYFLGQKSKSIVVFDKKPQEEVVGSGWWDTGMEWVCGPDYLKGGIKGFDIIVRSPGFYRYLPEIVEAEKEGAKITSNTILFFEESEANIIGITGTKGKGTTAQMLKLALEAGGKKVLLMGNIGTPMLNRIDDADTFDWVILELSSFQLIDLPYSPPIAVVTNIKTDHLNWHKDREEYVNAKKNLWTHQKPTDWVIFNKDDETSVELAKNAPGHVIWFNAGDRESKVNWENLGVIGKHNMANANAALTTAKVAGVDEVSARQGISKFKGAEHRMESVGAIDEVEYINDSAATTPEAAIAALESFEQTKILIAGGSLKGVAFKAYAEAIKENKVKAVFLIGESAKKIYTDLQTAGYKGQIYTDFEDMGSIVRKAHEIAESGDMVLLSPACASFGLFKDYKDRGEKFKEEIRNLR
ncbi:MAG: UDP-N-acetylmuramoyl-L-alanine--D-glutamate ligase [Candidatus Blackburnbacteria bacterium]|nr:UDP-N-acetylmuramoyl-L-alanine--D-glutamate ligase [Candidatus Blackburnbacteria bacterium]